MRYTYTNPDGCTTRVATAITVHPPPNLAPPPPVRLCNTGQPVDLGNEHGTWSGPGIIAPHHFDPSSFNGSTLVIFTNALGCSSAHVVFVDSMPEITFAVPAGYCSTQPTTQLEASPAGGIWSGPGIRTNGSFNPTGLTGDITIIYMATNGGCTAIASTSTRIDAEPVVSTSVANEACDHGVPLSANFTPGTGAWQALAGGRIDTVAGVPTVHFPASGAYLFELVVTNGACTTRDTVSIRFHDPEAPLWVNAGPDQRFDLMRNVELNGSAAADLELEWTIMSGSGVFSARNAPTTIVSDLAIGENIFRLTARQGGCRNVSDEVLVHVDDIFIPQGYSPNGDGVNETFHITGMQYFPESELRVFDRWGVQVHMASPYRNDWDGRGVGGTVLADGTYYYMLDLGDGRKYQGYVVIKR